jgi:NADH dehydrogenase
MPEAHVVIVGGGFGGLSAARVLSRRRGVRVTLLDRRNHHVFQPLLYQVATATLTAADIGAPIRWILRRASNVRVLLGEATAVDVSARRVTLAGGGRVDYDFLILAPGARHAYFDRPDWELHAPGLKTLEDAIDVRRRILLAFERAEREPSAALRRDLLTFVIVGGGPTGVELAGTLAEIARQTLRDEFRSIDTAKARVVVVEAGPSLLPTFRESLRHKARASLERLGVEVREGTSVTHIDAHGVEVSSVEVRSLEVRGVDVPSGDGPEADGRTERLNAGTVLWAAGVAAAPLVRTLGAPVDRAGRAIVEPDLSIPGHPEVFVVGDAAAFLHQGGGALPGVVQPAMQGAAHAARVILRRLRGDASQRFVYRDLGSMAIVGRGSAVADLGWVRLSGVLGWLAWLFLHIVTLIGFRNRVVVLVEWAVAYLTFQRSARLIMGDEAHHPKS